MATDRWRRIEEIFDEVLALPEGEREARLAELCGGDAVLRSEVASLLAADAGASDFLEHPPIAPADVALPPPSAVGRRLGPWRVESKLGEGGMATVYLGVRDDGEFRQQVAIKIFGYGADRSDLLERFRAERQILASLDHPNIARLLDGGTTEDGLPYLVMEHIDGIPIDRYCDERELGIDARIDLFRQVCSAVQYAHQHLVVHRDIKPSNILVTPEGRPHLLDFGIAKLLEGSAFSPMLTMTGQRLMTPHYASPEQVEGKVVTTASDVYSLGVLLYVLLTGRLPYRVDPDRMGAVEQAVLEQEPERPSTAVGRSSPGNGSIAPVTAERDRRLVRRLAGDLDNIVLMALRKEPLRRYASVELLSEDLRLDREGMPVRARPATLGYRAAKFVGRHPMGVGLAGGTFLLVLALAIVMTFQAVRLARQRDEIRHERDKAVAVVRLLEDVFSVSDPGEARGESITARELLDQGAARVQAELKDQPEVQAALATTIGKAYRGLGLNDRSLPLLEKSLALRRQIHGEEHPEVAESLEALGTLTQARGDLDRAETLHRQALAMRRKLFGPDDPAVAETLNSLAIDLLTRADFAAAEPLFREALAINRGHFGNDHEEVATNLANLGVLEKQRGHAAEAEALYREALAIMRRIFGPAHPMIATQLNNLAALQMERGDLAGAETSSREALAVSHRLYGEEHAEIALELNNLAALLTLRGDNVAAEALLRRSLAMRRKLLGPEHEQVAMGLNNLARVLEDEGKLAAARPLYEESLRITRKALGEEHPRVAATLANLATLSAAQGDLAVAEPLAEQALAIRRKTLGEAHPDVGASLVSLGSLRLARGSPAAAEPLLRQGLEILRAALPAGHWRIADAESQLGACLAARGRPTEAGPLLAAGYEALARGRGPSHPKTMAACERLSAFRKEHGGGPAVPCRASRPPA
ncbi:MAG TPA: serine/threonine-protein kinase [Thermoanaerobaculia bacterium]|nr:serine/threonine-protein kinase [Thermoanaerobaculia bacterium]